MKTTKTIYEEMLAYFELNSGNKPYGVIKPILGALSTQLTNVYAKLQYMQDNMFLRTADEESIHKHMGYELPRKEATRASGKVAITGTIDSLLVKIPNRTLLEDEKGNTYEIKNEAFTVKQNLYEGDLGAEIKYDKAAKEDMMYIDNLSSEGSYYYPPTPLIFLINGQEITRQGFVFTKESEEIKRIYFDKKSLEGIINVGDRIKVYSYRIDVTVKSAEGGEEYNKNFGESLYFRTAISNIDKEVKISSKTGIAGGKNVESRGEYLNRVLAYKTQSRAAGSKESIIYLIKEKHPTIAFVAIKGGGDTGAGPGKIRIYLLDYNYQLKDQDKEDVRDYVLKIISADVDPNNVTCEAPEIKIVDVVIGNIKPYNKELERQMKTELESFFTEGINNEPYFNRAVNIEKIRSRLYETVSGSISAESFNLIGVRIDGEDITGDKLPRIENGLYIFGQLIIGG